jgi:hypothetical protein
MLVGEIGIPRREFLYDLTRAEIILITRGYFRRYHPGWEQARFIGYHAAHAMGSRTPPPPPSQWFPLPWEKSAKPADSVTFTLDSATAMRGYTLVRDDGGLKLFPSGLIIIVK